MANGGDFFIPAKSSNQANAQSLNEYFHLQDFDKIELAQKARNARIAAKAASRQKPATVEILETVNESPIKEQAVIVGGPNRWKENGWKSSEHPLSEGRSYEGLLGKDATEDDRRAMFVVDSLMNEAAGNIHRNKAMWWKTSTGDDGFAKKGNHVLKPGESERPYGTGDCSGYPGRSSLL